MADATPTPTQAKYLSFIYAYSQGCGCSPAESEISQAMQVSAPSVHQMVKTLEKKGFISRQPGMARSIEVLISPESLPEWKKPIRSTRRVWMFVEPPAPKVKQEASKSVYRFKITLNETEPAIWRMIETLDVSLGQLHELIQTSMGWTNSHLHCFEIGEIRYSDPLMMSSPFADSNEQSYEGVKISDLVSEHGANFSIDYEYDFGDGWQHTVTLEAVVEPEPRIRYPRCIDGAGACPPEDIGGAWGFDEFLEAISDPTHERFDEFMEWCGPYDPKAFDPAKATRQMKKGLPGWD